MGEVHAGFWWRNLRKGANLEGGGVDSRIILKRIFDKRDGAQNGSRLLGTGTGGGLYSRVGNITAVFLDVVQDLR
jgi:hypothetical protein